MHKRIETMERDSTNRPSFKCPTCKNTYSDLEVNQLVDPMSGTQTYSRNYSFTFPWKNFVEYGSATILCSRLYLLRRSASPMLSCVQLYQARCPLRPAWLSNLCSVRTDIEWCLFLPYFLLSSWEHVCFWRTLKDISQNIKTRNISEKHDFFL